MINKKRVAIATQRNQVRIKRSFQSSRCGDIPVSVLISWAS